MNSSNSKLRVFLYPFPQVNLEDLMPGTDLGTVFNEFFSMYGPEIFDVIENNINKSDKLLNFLNNIFSPPPSNE